MLHEKEKKGLISTASTWKDEDNLFRFFETQKVICHACVAVDVLFHLKSIEKHEKKKQTAAFPTLKVDKI